MALQAPAGTLPSITPQSGNTCSGRRGQTRTHGLGEAPELNPGETASGPRTLKKVVLCVHVGVVGDDVKGGAPGHHFKHQDAQCPPVHAEPCRHGRGPAAGWVCSSRNFSPGAWPPLCPPSWGPCLFFFPLN